MFATQPSSQPPWEELEIQARYVRAQDKLWYLGVWSTVAQADNDGPSTHRIIRTDAGTVVVPIDDRVKVRRWR